MRGLVTFLVVVVVLGAFAFGYQLGVKNQHNYDQAQFTRDQQAINDSYSRGKADQARADCEQIRAFAAGRGAMPLH